MDRNDIDPPEGYRYILRASYWHWGLMRRLYAREYGLEAFRLKVRCGGPRRLPPDRMAAGGHARPSAPAPRRAVKRTPRRRSKRS
jgi:hypothetical protein